MMPDTSHGLHSPHPAHKENTVSGGPVRKSWLPVGLLWLGYTVLLVALTKYVNILPAEWAEEAHVVDEAFLLLMYLGSPVMALVLAVMTWGVIGWRSEGADREDGPNQQNNRVLVTTWLVITSALAIGVLINPGFVGLAEIRGEPSSDYVIEIQAAQFFWEVTYPNGETALDELVVPAEMRVRYDVSSVDVLHSFWIPAFRVKIDAVPGVPTQVYTTATAEGTSDDDVNLRVQCAELCGAGHASMAMPVRVVSDAEFNEYVESLGGSE
jgi:cytochrome c oxidase subunit 2